MSQRFEINNQVRDEAISFIAKKLVADLGQILPDERAETAHWDLYWIVATLFMATIKVAEGEKHIKEVSPSLVKKVEQLIDFFATNIRIAENKI